MAEIIHEIQECCVKFDQHSFLGIAAPPPPPRLVSSSSEEAIFFQNTEFSTFFLVTKKHTESTCYFYVNRRARIAYSEYRIAYSEYRIPYISMLRSLRSA